MIDQNGKREEMTQTEIDALLRHIEQGESFFTPDFVATAEASKACNDNFRQLQYAIKRCILNGVANVSLDDIPQRLAQVHYYAHRNWYLKKGFANKKEYKAFMNKEARRKGITLNW